MSTKDRDGNTLKKGDRVRIITRGSPCAYIESFMDDVEHGVVVDRQVEGTCCWNGPRDLVKLPRIAP